MPRRRDDCDDLSFLDRFSMFVIATQWQMRRFVRRLLRPGAFLISLAIFVAGVAQALKEADIPSKSAWDNSEPLGVVALTSAVVGLVGGFLVSLGYARELKRRRQNEELGDLCKSVWVIAVREFPAIEFTKIGVHVWAVRGLWGARYLEKRATFIPEARRSTPITWRQGKGAIGLCWRLNQELVADVEKLERKGPDKTAFCALPEEERFGFSWRDLQESKRYRAILAMPLRRGFSRTSARPRLPVGGPEDRRPRIGPRYSFQTGRLRSRPGRV
jgi:uncharacterized integral membrane protein